MSATQEILCEQAGLLLIDRLEGVLDETDQALLQRHLDACADCRREAQELETTWAELGSLPAPPAPPGVERRFQWWLRGELRRGAALPDVAAGEAPGRRGAPRWAIAVAASLVSLLVGIGFGSRRETAEMDGLRADVKALNQLVALSLLKQSSASERLLGVSQGRQMAPANDTLVRALLETATGDENPNVRLAAVDALGPVVGRSEVRDALLAAFPRDGSPLVQAAIAAALLDANDAEARRRLATELEADAPLDPGVRQYLVRRMAEGGTV